MATAPSEKWIVTLCAASPACQPQGGFQVVASQNARKFNYKTTTVYANTQASYPAAERAGRLLGAGAVTLGHSPVSGLADITIVVGKDF